MGASLWKSLRRIKFKIFMERIQNGWGDICPVSKSRRAAALGNFALVA